MARLSVSESSLVALAVLGLLVATGLPFVLPLVASDVSTPGPPGAGSATTPGTATDRGQPTDLGAPVTDSDTAVADPRPGVLTPPPDARRDGAGETDRAYCAVGPAGTADAGLDSLARLDADDPTGANVTVAVLDPTGFDVDDPRIRDSVVETASFAAREESSVGNDGFDQHGTASATLVNRVSPEADLLLANFRTARDFTRAVEWALDRGADVVVAPTVFYAKPDDGSAPVSRAVADAADAGVPVVVPTGNAAQRHWAGTHGGGEWVEFADGRTRLSLRGSSDRVRLWLWWNESDAGDPPGVRPLL